MSERDRLFHPLTGSLAGVFLLLIGPALLGSKQEEPAQRSNQTQAQIEQTVDPAVSIVSIDSEGYQSAADERDDRDVMAQERMADAAEFAAGVSVYALLGLGGTIIFAALAWWEARKSADADNEALAETRAESKRQQERFDAQLAAAATEAEVQEERFNRQLAAQTAAAQAARDSVGVTQTIGQAQVRAYPTIKHLLLRIPKPGTGLGKVSVVCVVQNSGQTPVQRVLGWGLVELTTTKDAEPPGVKKFGGELEVVRFGSARELVELQPIPALAHAHEVELEDSLGATVQAIAEEDPNFHHGRDLKVTMFLRFEDVFGGVQDVTVTGRKRVVGAVNFTGETRFDDGKIILGDYRLPIRKK